MPSTDTRAALEQMAEAVHQAYLDTCARLGWGVKPENQVPYAALSEDSKELDRASVRAVLDALARSAPVEHGLVEAVRLLWALRCDADAVERHGLEGTARMMRARLDKLNSFLIASPHAPEERGEGEGCPHRAVEWLTDGQRRCVDCGSLALASPPAPVEGERERILAAIDAEPEPAGEMPDRMWEKIRSDRAWATEMVRATVEETKEGIRERILAAIAAHPVQGERDAKCPRCGAEDWSGNRCEHCDYEWPAVQGEREERES